jgi:hypothetical protein
VLHWISRSRKRRAIDLGYQNRRFNSSVCRTNQRALATTLATMHNDERPKW